MKVMFAGDTHGNINHWMRLFEIAADEQVDEIIQVGDFGYWEHTPEGVAFLDVLSLETPCLIRFIDGNHDNHPLLWSKYPYAGGLCEVRRGVTYQKRGSVKGWDDSDAVMQFMGGAFSIDYAWRQKANLRGPACWWPEEIITDDEIRQGRESAAWFDKIDILVTHDVPSGAPLGRLTNLTLSNTLETQAQYNRRQLLKLVKATKPKLLIHGHYHTRLDYFMHYTDLNGEEQRLDCIGLSCDPESHHKHGPMEESYVIRDLEDLLS
jgi:hypothetical protein